MNPGLAIFAAAMGIGLGIGVPGPVLSTPQLSRVSQAERAEPARDSRLAPGADRELVLRTCTVCHSSSLITSSRLTRRRWSETLVTMQEKYGMKPPTEAERNRILDYLVATQGPDPDSSREPLPWGQPLYRPNPIW